MSPILQAILLVCDDDMTVPLHQVRFLIRAPIHTVIQEVEARGFKVVR